MAFVAEAIWKTGGSMFYSVWVVLVGILAGWLAGRITKGRGFGVLGDLIVCILGLTTRDQPQSA